jgi:drug/metabolite transporter (DMT)-like permease
MSPATRTGSMVLYLKRHVKQITCSRDGTAVSTRTGETTILSVGRTAVTASRVRVRTGIPWQARLIALASIWGMSFLFIKVGVQALAPLQVSLGRMLFGTATLLLILMVRRVPLPRGRSVWFHLAVAAVLLNAVPFTLFAYGEVHATSVLAGIWNATTPLFTAPIAILMLRTERFSRPRLVGLLIGFAGVLIVLGIWNGAGGALGGNLLCLGAAVSYALGFPYARRYLTGRPDSVLALATGQLICGTIELAILAPLVTHAPHSIPLKALGSVLILGVLGTGVAYILNYGLIRDAGATNATTVAYLMPLVATVAGVLILGEPLTWYEPMGAVVVILGVAISQGRIPIVRAGHLVSRARRLGL